ncbi:MAG: NADH-quinone oxidoreductase subunit H [Verrucomicrobiae bacterium]|nr:NADH-quinone oxidoreductase subunit H [Verrucomicrobiae bacterium]
MKLLSLIHPFLALLLAPLLLGVINRVKAVFAGRRGQPLLQAYYDIWKLLGKGAVYSRTTTWVFRAGPVIGLTAVISALMVLPFAGQSGVISFSCDFVVMAYLLGLARFFTIAAALDTGSSFEGMGASREAQFSALAEPALLLGLAALAVQSSSLSLSDIFTQLNLQAWMKVGPAILLVAAAMAVVLLAENSRIPVDDPNTHLELTMIHEVMVLDHGGPDFAYILYGAALKLWLFAALLVNVLMPVQASNVPVNFAVALTGMFVAAIGVGVVESIMARLRLLKVPQLLVGAAVLSTLALVLLLR